MPLAIPTDRGILVGFAYALLVGHFVTRLVIDAAWGRTKKSDEARRDRTVHPAMVGYIERAIVAGAVMAGRPELAAGWFVIKAAAVWKEWTNDRDVFNVFVIGTGLSALFGSIGGLLALAIGTPDSSRIVVLAIFATVLALSLRFADQWWLRWLFGNPGQRDEAGR